MSNNNQSNYNNPYELPYPPLTSSKNQVMVNGNKDIGEEQRFDDNYDDDESSIARMNNNQEINGPFYIGPNGFKYPTISALKRFVAHQDFCLFMFLATKVKIIRNDLVCGNKPDTTDLFSISYAESTKGKEEVNASTRVIQSILLMGKNLPHVHPSLIIPRGTFKQTDDMMEESIITLSMEFNRCMTWYNALQKKAPPVSPPRMMRVKGRKKGNFCDISD